MDQTHVIRHNDAKVRDQFEGHSAMPWFDEGVYNPPHSQLLGHAGGTGGYNSFVGLDLQQRVGVAVLTNQSKIHSSMVGWRILQHARLDGLDAIKMMPVREIVGIGTQLDLDRKTQALQITGTLPNSPAEQAGLSGRFIVQSIDGVATAGKSLANCLALIHGPEGSTIRLELVDDNGKSKTIELTRQKFRLGV
jgi:hypothetical protein